MNLDEFLKEDPDTLGCLTQKYLRFYWKTFPSPVHVLWKWDKNTDMTKYKLLSASSLSFLPLRVHVGVWVTVGGCGWVEVAGILPNRRHKTTHLSSCSLKNQHSLIFTTSLIRPLVAIFRFASRLLELHGRNDFHAVEEKHNSSPYCVIECPQQRRQCWNIRCSLLHWSCTHESSEAQRATASTLPPLSNALTSFWCWSAPVFDFTLHFSHLKKMPVDKQVCCTSMRAKNLLLKCCWLLRHCTFEWDHVSIGRHICPLCASCFSLEFP